MTDRNKTEQIRIYGKDLTITMKNFDSLDEFNQYYSLHKDEIDNMTTKRLNKLYHIKDYKITRRKLKDNDESKTLCFQLIKSNSLQEHEDFEQTLTNVNIRIKALELENTKIKQQLVEIINVINSN